MSELAWLSASHLHGYLPADACCCENHALSAAAHYGTGNLTRNSTLHVAARGCAKNLTLISELCWCSHSNESSMLSIRMVGKNGIWQVGASRTAAEH